MASNEICQCPNCGSNIQGWFFEKMKDEMSKLDLSVQPSCDSKNQFEAVEKPKMVEQKTHITKEPENKIESEINKTITNDHVLPDKFLRPALRGFFLYWIYILLSTFVVMFPMTTISIFMASDNMDKIGDWPWMISIIQILGFMMGAFFGFKILVQWLGNRYKLGINDVESAEGIVARNKSNVRYAHIRSAEVKQGIIDRLLDVGSVELATAGSAEVEIIFKGVLDPVAIQNEVNERIAASQDRTDD